MISPEDAYELLEDIAIINGIKKRLRLYKPTKEKVIEEKKLKKIENYLRIGIILKILSLNLV